MQGKSEFHDLEKCEEILGYLTSANEDQSKGLSFLDDNKNKIKGTTRCTYKAGEMSLDSWTKKTPLDIVNHYLLAMDEYLKQLLKYENEDYYSLFGISGKSILTSSERRDLANCILSFDTLDSFKMLKNIGSIENLIVNYKELLNINELTNYELTNLVGFFSQDYNSIGGIPGVVLQSNLFTASGIDSYIVNGFGEGMIINAADAASLQYIFNMLNAVSDGQFLNNGSLVQEGKPSYSLHRQGKAFDIFTSFGIRVRYNTETKEVDFLMQGKNCNEYASNNGLNAFTMYDVFYVVPELKDGSSPNIDELFDRRDYTYHNYIMLKPDAPIPKELEKYIRTGPLDNVLTVDNYKSSVPTTKDGNLYYTTITPSESLGEKNSDLKFLDFTALCNDNGWRGIGPHEGWEGKNGRTYQDSEWHHIQAMSDDEKSTSSQPLLVIDNSGNIVNPEVLTSGKINLNTLVETESSKGTEVGSSSSMWNNSTSTVKHPYVYTTAPGVNDKETNNDDLEKSTVTPTPTQTAPATTAATPSTTTMPTAISVSVENKGSVVTVNLPQEEVKAMKELFANKPATTQEIYEANQIISGRGNWGTGEDRIAQYKQEGLDPDRMQTIIRAMETDGKFVEIDTADEFNKIVNAAKNAPVETVTTTVTPTVTPTPTQTAPATTAATPSTTTMPTAISVSVENKGSVVTVNLPQEEVKAMKELFANKPATTQEIYEANQIISGRGNWGTGEDRIAQYKQEGLDPDRMQTIIRAMETDGKFVEIDTADEFNKIVNAAKNAPVETVTTTVTPTVTPTPTQTAPATTAATPSTTTMPTAISVSVENKGSVVTVNLPQEEVKAMKELFANKPATTQEIYEANQIISGRGNWGTGEDRIAQYKQEGLDPDRMQTIIRAMETDGKFVEIDTADEFNKIVNAAKNAPVETVTTTVSVTTTNSEQIKQEKNTESTNQVANNKQETKVNTSTSSQSSSRNDTSSSTNYENTTPTSNIIETGIKWPDNIFTKDIPKPDFGVTGMETAISNNNFIYTIYGCESDEINNYRELLRKLFKQLNENTFYRESDKTTICLLEKNSDDIELRIYK